MDWNSFDKGIFLVNVLGIVYDPDTKKILIGRRENDEQLPQLTWCFPGGRPEYEKDLEEYLKQQVKIKTNLDVDVKKLIFARIMPEKKEFLLIYYLCKVEGREAKAQGKFVEVKWVKPTEVTNYFTTSLHPKVFEFLKTLE
ncbi:MAG: NUDIX domain-containing protein [Candidatus Woesearchaeota archaeon]|nr:MAG: NUDIX domain-containing protein [Candidatus Woesearchaeota archaeon]